MSYYSTSEKQKLRRYIIGGCVLWFIIAILLDHFIFKNSWYARIFALGNAKISFDPFYGDFSHLSFTTFLLVPLLVIVFTLIVSTIRKERTIKEIVRYVFSTTWWTVIIVLAVVIGHMVYRLISGLDWNFIQAIVNFCEGYKIEGQIYLFTLSTGVTVKSGVGAIVGFVIGIYCYYKKEGFDFFVEKMGLNIR